MLAFKQIERAAQAAEQVHYSTNIDSQPDDHDYLFNV
jgi:hypothetical protein